MQYYNYIKGLVNDLECGRKVAFEELYWIHAAVSCKGRIPKAIFANIDSTSKKDLRKRSEDLEEEILLRLNSPRASKDESVALRLLFGLSTLGVDISDSRIRKPVEKDAQDWIYGAAYYYWRFCVLTGRSWEVSI